MAEQEIQQLSQAVNENSHYLRQNAQVMTESNTCITECTRTLADKLGDLEFGHVNEHKDKFSTGHIRMFNGEPKYFDQWMKSIEKHAFLARYGDQRKQLLAYEFSTGIVGDYIRRYIESDGFESWENLKENLTSRFSTLVDKPKAFEMLVNTRQKRDEDIQFYGERLSGLCQKGIP